MMDYLENKVSIIIPTHNSEKYLEECIESALNQTYQDIEIIAVDDGSTDNSLEILKKYSNKIKIITMKSCLIGAAFNQGLKIAKGEWIKRLDSDDVLYPNAVENLVSVGKNIEDKKKTILYGHLDVINSSGEILRKRTLPNYNDLEIFDFNVILLDHMMANSSTSLIHRSTIDEYGMYNESNTCTEDYELWLTYCLLHNCRLHLIPKTILKFRIHSSQLSYISAKNVIKESSQIRNSVLEKLNPKDRLLYEKALLRHKKTKPFLVKFGFFVRNNIIFNLPVPISNRIMFFVRSMNKGARKFSGLDQ